MIKLHDLKLITKVKNIIKTTISNNNLYEPEILKYILIRIRFNKCSLESLTRQNYKDFGVLPVKMFYTNCYYVYF